MFTTKKDKEKKEPDKKPKPPKEKDKYKKYGVKNYVDEKLNEEE